MFSRIFLSLQGCISSLQIKFRDRSAAGEILALMLKKYKRREEQPIVIIGIPRGGVVVADVVARKLSADFDIVIPHCVPFHNNLLINIVSIRILCTCMIIYINLRNSKKTFIVISIYIEKRNMNRT
jgi:predicted phosphoribosyltransferase